MKQIKSIDEALKASEKGLVVDIKGNLVYLETHKLCSIRLWVNDGGLYWKPEEVELVECRTNDSEFPVIYVPKSIVDDGNGQRAVERMIPGFRLTVNHNRTLTGTIREVI